jgi:electron transport complex protein RnfD
MEFVRRDAPYLAPKVDVPSIMRQVLYALIPGTIVHVWYFGPGLILNMRGNTCICVTTADTLVGHRNRFTVRHRGR